jgi:Type II secretion system (T2SS), protein M subtype b
VNFLRSLTARFQAMSRRERVLVVGCAVALAAAAAMKWAIVPARAQYERNRVAIRQRVSTIARYEAVRKGQDRIEEELSRQTEQLAKWEGGLLAGENSSAAGVFLQGLLRPLTQGAQTRVTAVRGLPPMRRGAYTEIAVQLDIQTTTEELARLLADIARQPRLLHVRKFAAHVAAYYGGRQRPARETVTVSMVVAGLSAAPLDEKSAAGGEEP